MKEIRSYMIIVLSIFITIIFLYNLIITGSTVGIIISGIATFTMFAVIIDIVVDKFL